MKEVEVLNKNFSAEDIEYVNKVNTFVEAEDHKYDNLNKYYGPKGKMNSRYKQVHPQFTDQLDEYDKLEIEKPADMSDSLFLAITLGSFLGKDFLEKFEPDKQYGEEAIKHPNFTLLENNRTMIVEDFNSDIERSHHYIPIAVESRKKAQNLIPFYKRAKIQVVNTVNNVIEHAISSLETTNGYTSDPLDPERFYSNMFVVVSLANEMLDLESVKEKYREDDIGVMKLRSFAKQMEAYEKAAKIKKRILTEPNARNSNDRKALAEELIFNMLLGDLSKADFANTMTKSAKLMDDVFLKMGLFREQNDPNMTHIIFNPDANQYDSNAANSISNAYAKYSISDLQTILVQPDGIEQLKNLYGPAIRSSSMYKKLVGAKDEELVKTIKEVEAATREKSFYQFPKVQIPNVSAEINAGNIDKIKEIIDKNVESVKNKTYEFMNDKDTDYVISAFDKQSLNHNVEIIERMMNDFGNNTQVKGAPASFGGIKEEMGKLLEYAKSLNNGSGEMSFGEYKKYKKLVNNAVKAIETYQESETNLKEGSKGYDRIVNSGYLKRYLNANLLSFDKAYMGLFDVNNASPKVMEEILKLKIKNEYEKLDKWDPRNLKENDIFRQGENKYGPLEIPGCSYSYTRTAVYTIATLYLVSQNKNGANYTIEDLVGFGSKTKEKSDAFDEVVRRMKDPNPENQKWIAQAIYDGEHELSKLVNERAAKLDFSDPATVSSDDFSKLGYLAHLQFDGWQEMSHCKDEIVAIAQREHPEIKDYNDVNGYISTLFGAPVSAINNHKKMLGVLNDYALGKSNDISTAVELEIGHKISMKIIADGLKAGKTATGSMDADTYGVLKEPVRHLETEKEIKKLTQTPEISGQVAKMLMDGTLLKDMTFTLDVNNQAQNKKMVVEGIPTVEDVKLEKALDAIPRKLRDISYSKLVERLDGMKAGAKPENHHYLDKAVGSYGLLHSIIKKDTTIEAVGREKIKDVICDIYKAEILTSYEESGLAGEALDEALNKAITDLHLENIPDKGFLGLGKLAQFVYEDRAVDLVREKSAAIKTSAEKYRSDYERQVKADKRNDQVLRETMHQNNIARLRTLGTTMQGVGSFDLKSDLLYEKITIPNDGSYATTAFDSNQTEGEDIYRYVTSSQHPAKIINIEKFEDYKKDVNTYLDDCQRVLDNEQQAGKLSDKTVEFVKAFGLNAIKRNLDGRTDAYLMSRTPIPMGMDLITASISSKINEGLDEKIKKHNDRYPIFDIIIESDQQQETLLNYWTEKEAGPLSAEREDMYRKLLFNQTVSLIEKTSKFDAAVNNKEENQRIRDLGIVEQGNDPFEMGSHSPRGMGLYVSSLEAYKCGLANGWSIDDLGVLATFNFIVDETVEKTKAIKALRLSEYKEHAPAYKDEAHKNYIEKMVELKKEILTKPLKDYNERKAYLYRMNEIINNGVSKGYITDPNYSTGFEQTLNHSKRVTRDIDFGKASATYSRVNAEAARVDKKIVRTYKESEYEKAMKSFNANRTDKYIGNETEIHLNLRLAAERMNEALKNRYDNLNAGADFSVEDKLRQAAEYIGVLDETIYYSKIYQKERAGASSEGGKERLKGSKDLEDFARRQRNDVLRELKEQGVAVDTATVQEIRKGYASIRMGNAINSISTMKTFPQDAEGKQQLMDLAADIMVFKFANSTIETNRKAFENMGATRLKNQILKDSDFKKLINSYMKTPNMNPVQMANELVDETALNKLKNLNKKYIDENKDKNKDFEKKQEQMKKRIPKK